MDDKIVWLKLEDMYVRGPNEAGEFGVVFPDGGSVAILFPAEARQLRDFLNAHLEDDK